MVKKIFIVPVLLLSACSSLGGPTPILMDTHVDGSPEFQAGWKDGCESGFATYGTAPYKMFYSFTQNYSMLHSPDYKSAWHEAFDYCRHYIYRWNTHDLYTDPL